MKNIKYILLFIFSYIFTINVYADTCSYKEQITLNNDLSNIKITYEIIDDNQINILIYNITENIYISYTNQDTEEESNIFLSDTENGKYVIRRNANSVEEYSFELRSNISACYGNILSTKKIVKPGYNKFHTLEICDDKKLINHSYCQKYITSEINKSEEEVKKILQDFLSSKVEKITTTKQIEHANNIKTFFAFSSIGVIVIGIIVTVLLIKKKRSEL